MKKLLLVFALLVTGFAIRAQDIKKNNDSAPSNITSAFKQKYPNATDVDWDQSGSNYEAKFSEGKKDFDVFFNSKGQWMSTEISDIPASEIPMEVQNGLNSSEYQNWQVGEVQSKETPGDVTYKVGVKKGMKMRELQFDKHGKIVSDKSKI
jgi:hypothetical protein